MTLSNAQSVDNPFFAPTTNPYGAPPFDRLKTAHYLPAFEKGIQLHDAEIARIATNKAAPTFANTIAALDVSGPLLRDVTAVFFALTEAETNDEMDAISEKVTPMLSEHSDNLYLNPSLFRRVRTLYQKRNQLKLSTEQRRVLEKYYRDFVRSGAALGADAQRRLREINKELAVLSLKFSDNVLKETNAFRLVIDTPSDLAGLPQSVIDAAKETANSEQLEGKWVFTIQKPSLIPFLQFSEKRALREKLFKAYYNKGDNDNANDNKEIVARMVNLRLERARLLGYPSHAAYVLDENMAKKPETVLAFLEKIWQPALKAAKQEVKQMQDLIDAEGGGFRLQPWDWWYYSEKLRKASFDLDETQLRPYFKLENVRQGVFEVANRLYGIRFEPVKGVPVYHPDVEVFRVLDRDGKFLGLFYTDYFPRPGKRAGAWMGNFREQYWLGGEDVRPLIYNVGNLTKPTPGTPSLLDRDEVETLFHEFGHALHGLLSQCHYPYVSGTNVARDFVELPSQIMENWCMHPDVLRLYARHYQTGAPMPDSLIQKIHRAETFNQGFETTELVAAALLDMHWHTQTTAQTYDVRAFERNFLESEGLLSEILPRYRTTFFNHAFSGGYSAGYYAYLWAEVLDADAFNLFQQRGVFDPATAQSFRKNILEKGNSEDPMVLYRRFRGAEPNPEALLKRRGL
jgi:peptidyl-dipeptidase Dcp